MLSGRLQGFILRKWPHFKENILTLHTMRQSFSGQRDEPNTGKLLNSCPMTRHALSDQLHRYQRQLSKLREGTHIVMAKRCKQEFTQVFLIDRNAEWPASRDSRSK
jgi:hypothetical protein